MADNPKAKIGLPEIMVGIFPGGAARSRLFAEAGRNGRPRRSFWRARCFDPRKAKGALLVDEVVAPGELMARAKEWVLNAKDADIVKPWDQKGWKMPGGAPYHPAGFMTFVGASAMINGKTKGVYPAAKALLSAVYEGALVPFRHGAQDRGALVHQRPDEPVPRP
jgi:3-hydroxyacyl-CoA dehydrogenase/enoyl-CoA hydratase/3-hydroxybutyryl-CoA epimerase